MNRLSVLLATATLALGLAACSGDAEINLGGDSTDNDSGLNILPNNDGADTIGSNDTSADANDTGGALGNVGQDLTREGIEKLVETQLLISDGFKNVEVESEDNGVIILKGTVASDAEKEAAEAEARKVGGVKEVRNQITVGS